MDERPSRAHEPNDQGSHCSTLSLRSTRSARSSPRRIHQRLQLRPPAEDPKGPHPLRIHLQMLDFPARTIQTQSAPENAGTKHLEHLVDRYCCFPFSVIVHHRAKMSWQSDQTAGQPKDTGVRSWSKIDSYTLWH